MPRPSSDLVNGEFTLVVGNLRGYRLFETTVRFIAENSEQHAIQIVPSLGSGVEYKVMFTGMPRRSHRLISEALPSGW